MDLVSFGQLKVKGLQPFILHNTVRFLKSSYKTIIIGVDKSDVGHHADVIRYVNDEFHHYYR